MVKEKGSLLISAIISDDPFPSAQVGTTDGAETYDDTSVSSATDYVYRIDAVYPDGVTVSLPTVDASTPPSAPVQLDIPQVSLSGITLTWQAGPGVTPDQYEIYRSNDSDPSNFVLAATVSGTTTSYNDISISAGRTYYYEVAAVVAGQDSGTVGAAMALVPPANVPPAPTGVTATPNGNGIDVTWSGMGSSAVRLRIDRAAGSGSFVSIAYIIPAEGGFHDPYVNAGTTYTYRIVAQNAAGSSAASNSAAAVAPAAAQGEAGMPPLPAEVPDSTLDGSWIGGFYADGEVVSAGWNGGPGGPLADVSEAQAKINQDGFSQEIQVVPAPDSHLGLLHVYKISKWFGGSVYIGSYTFDPKDTNDTDSKIAAAENSANSGRINSGAKATAQVLAIGTAVAGVFIPGPDDIILGAVIEKAVTVLSKAGIKAIFKGGTWLFKKGSELLVGEAADAEYKVFRTEVIEQIGAKDVAWSMYNNKHVVGKDVNWSAVVKATKDSPAKYLPGTPVELMERYVWAKGTPVTNGKKWKVMAFDHFIGASEGKQVQWMRVEFSGGSIHGHPISLQEYRMLTR